MIFTYFLHGCKFSIFPVLVLDSDSRIHTLGVGLNTRSLNYFLFVYFSFLVTGRNVQLRIGSCLA